MKMIRRLRLKPVVHPDTAGAAAEVARLKDPTRAALASSLAAEIYGLKILKVGMEDAQHLRPALKPGSDVQAGLIVTREPHPQRAQAA